MRLLKNLSNKWHNFVGGSTYSRAINLVAKKKYKEAKMYILKIYGMAKADPPSDRVPIVVNILYSLVCLRLYEYGSAVSCAKCAVDKLSFGEGRPDNEVIYLGIYCRGIIAKASFDGRMNCNDMLRDIDAKFGLSVPTKVAKHLRDTFPL